MRRSLAVVVMLVVTLFAPLSRASAALPGGPVILMGIDAEDGGPGGHGPISTYVNVVNDVLANVTNGGTGILVVGGGKSPGDGPTSFWNAIGTATGRPITYANGTAVASVPFAGFAMIGIVSTVYDTSNGLTEAENTALAGRQDDIASHINNGGGLLGFNQNGLSQLYGYLSGLGAFTVNAGLGYVGVTPTPEGAAIGIGASDLDVCCWHDEYVSFPSFLSVLVTNDDTGRPAAIGGKKVIVLRACTDAEMSAEMSRPAAGRVYLDDADIGAAPTAEPLVKGFGVTIAAAATGMDRVEIAVDGVTIANLTAAPFQTTIATPSLGQHTVRLTAIDDDLACGKQITRTFTVDCVGVGVQVTRPAAGRAYLDNQDVGTSGGAEPFLLGGQLRVEAVATDVPHTADVSFAYDAGAPFGTDTTGNPFEAQATTDTLAPGTHLLRATLREHTAGCVATAVVLVRRQDPKVKAVAEGVFVGSNIPAEPQVHAGGAQVGGTGGSSSVRVLDRSAGPVDHVHAVTDSATGSVAPFTSSSESLVTDVSLAGGLITADMLHAKAHATFDIPSLTGTAVDAGSEIANLRIAGNPVPVSAPNTVVPLPGGLGRVVLQETIVDTSGFTREVTVNMIHAFLTTPSFTGEIVIASAHAGVSLPGGPFVGPASDLLHLPNDAGSGRDAGSTAATGVALTDGTYGGGMLTTSDNTDVYTFSAGQGDRISIEMLPSIRERVAVGAGPTPTTVGPVQPDFDLYLRDPSGALRDTSVAPVLGGSIPERVELNADTPYAPAGARGTWSVEVQRRTSFDGFYTLNLHVLPAVLLEQRDGDLPGDASASCANPRALPVNGTENDVRAYTGVIRDDDQGDTYSVPAQIGQTLAVTLKPDELGDGADFDLFLYAPSSPGGQAECAFPYSASQLGKEPLPKALPELVAALPVRISGTYVFEVRRINAVANYSFEVSVLNDQPTLPGNDASTGSDAGDTCAAPTTLNAGLYQGRLGDLPDDDREDWYAVSLTAGQDLAAVMKSAEPNDLTLRLYRPDCTPAAPGTLSLSSTPLSAPESAHVRDATAGVWRLSVTRGPGTSDGGNYALAIAVTP